MKVELILEHLLKFKIFYVVVIKLVKNSILKQSQPYLYVMFIVAYAIIQTSPISIKSYKFLINSFCLNNIFSEEFEEIKKQSYSFISTANPIFHQLKSIILSEGMQQVGPICKVLVMQFWNIGISEQCCLKLFYFLRCWVNLDSQFYLISEFKGQLVNRFVQFKIINKDNINKDHV